MCRIRKVVGTARFELTTLCPPGRCATRLRYAPTFCGLYGIAAGAASTPVHWLAFEENQDLFQLLTHLLDDLRRDGRLAAA